ncbi:MAG TPA: hypothetical protein VMV13_08930, partial [Candidatus Binataceae bacterium]|nr:hypothetical protein [Candidatus Binataceae bacterium]
FVRRRISTKTPERRMIMLRHIRRSLLRGSALALAVLAYGCAAQQATVVEAPRVPPTVHALPFQGRLVEGDPTEIPQAVALSLSGNSQVQFSYREELTHDEHHYPLWLTALAPSTYFGGPLGKYDVTAFATLSISDRNTVIGYYTAKALVSRSYTIYSEPTHAELERDARTEVRDKIDAELAFDRNRLAGALAQSRSSAIAPGNQ